MDHYATVRFSSCNRDWRDEFVENGKARVLIIDSASSARTVADIVAGCSCDFEIARNACAAYAAIEQHRADLVISALRPDSSDAFELLHKIHTLRPSLPVVILAEEPSISSAVAAMRHGAFDYARTPPDLDELTSIINRALEMISLRRENRRLREQLDVAGATAGFVAESAVSRQLTALIRRVAPTRSTVLIEGESGTGKELVARMLHYWSNRAQGPFVAVNCKAFSDGVVESELFGHEKGSFTGAIAARAGCFERASGGTLFLDEIGEAGPDFQTKLLRVLEDGEVLRVGASKSRKVDVRIIAATNRSLRSEIARDHFRSDLYFRLNVIPLRIPPLRERPADIVPLANHFLAFHTAETGRQIALSAEAEKLLSAYPWPGNVRELENAIERAVVLAPSDLLSPDAFALEPIVSPPSLVAEMTVNPVSSSDESLQACLDRATVAKIKAALAASRGNRAETATTLGIDRTTLYRLMKRLDLDA